MEVTLCMAALATELTDNMLKYKGISSNHPCYQKQFKGYYDHYIEIITKHSKL